MSMKIGIAGGPGVGKSTLAKDLCGELTAKGFTAEAPEEFARIYIKRFGPPHNIYEQSLFLLGQKAQEERVNADFVISDCPKFLSYLYLIPFADLNNPKHNYLIHKVYEQALATLSEYNYFIYIPKEFPFKENGVRYQTDKETKRLDRMIKSFFNIHRLRRLTVRGTPEQRLGQAMEYIKGSFGYLQHNSNKSESLKFEESKRPSWDEYFMNIAKIAASRSHCYSRKVGTVLVKGRSIISTGYNGPPMGVSHCEARHPQGKKECPRQFKEVPSGQGLWMCPAAHAERNAIVLAARNGVSVEGTTLYLYSNKGGSSPCKDCAIEIINAGIREVVCFTGQEYDERPDAIKATDLFKEAGIKVRVFTPTTEG